MALPDFLSADRTGKTGRFLAARAEAVSRLACARSSGTVYCLCTGFVPHMVWSLLNRPAELLNAAGLLHCRRGVAETQHIVITGQKSQHIVEDFPAFIRLFSRNPLMVKGPLRSRFDEKHNNINRKGRTPIPWVAGSSPAAPASPSS